MGMPSRNPPTFLSEPALFLFSRQRREWPDELLETLASGELAPWQTEEIQSSLLVSRFGAILSSIERIRSGLDGAPKIAFFQQWIEANQSSPLLYAAWFNIGVMFAHEGDNTSAAIACGNAVAAGPPWWCRQPWPSA
jgi:hypothetical protein